MLFFYNIGIRLYRLAIGLASFSNPKAKLWIEGRKETCKKLENIQREDKTAWFHCASLGEFEQGRPIIERFKVQYPDFKILLTFFSPSGYEIRKNYPHADYIMYLPLDTAKNAKKFIQFARPAIAIFVKYEFWYHFLNELRSRKIPTYSISSIFRKQQIFFKPYGKWYRKTLSYFKHIFVQNEESKKLLNGINTTNVTVSGDTRFDRVSEIASQAKDIIIIRDFKQDDILFIIGSSWEQDEEIIAHYINQDKTETKWIFAPHEIRKANIDRLEKLLTVKSVRFSDAGATDLHTQKVLIIDNIGMLASAYKYGDIAYVGGAFKTGLHNVLEPATFGIPVLCGPLYSKFKEAVDLVNLGGLLSVNNYTEFKKDVDQLINDETKRKQLGEINMNYINKEKGATDKIMGFLKSNF